MRRTTRLLLIVITIAAIAYALNISKHLYFKANKSDIGKVIDFQNNLLILEDNKLIRLAGVYIPISKDINYREEIVNNAKYLLCGKKIRYRIISKGTHVINAYPYYDLAVVYIDNDIEPVNKKLLKNGMAFFDHGYYKDRDKYLQLEKEARSSKIGLWKNEPKVLYIGSRNWWAFHYPECPKVKEISDKNRIYYYFLPNPIFYYNTGPELDCRYCKEIEKKFKRPLLFRIDEKGMSNKKVGDIVD